MEKESIEVKQKDKIEYLEQELTDLRSQLQQAQKRNDELEKQIQESKNYWESIQKYGGVFNRYMNWSIKAAAKKISFWICKQDIFDESYYLAHNQDLQNYPYNLLIHYLLHGGQELRAPGPRFDPQYYCCRYPDIEPSETNPLYHYIRFGFWEGRVPKEDADMYLEWCAFNSKSTKCLKRKIQRLKDIFVIYRSGAFDGNWYLREYEDVRKELEESKFWNWRYSSNPLKRLWGRFRTSAIVHYVNYGVYEGRNPNGLFQTSAYIRKYPDLYRFNGLNPFVHYIRHGRQEGRSTREENSDPSSFLQQYTDRQLTYGTVPNIWIVLSKAEMLCPMDQLLEGRANKKKIRVVLLRDQEAQSIQTRHYQPILADNLASALEMAGDDPIWIPSQDTHNWPLMLDAARYFADEEVMAVWRSGDASEDRILAAMEAVKERYCMPEHDIQPEDCILRCANVLLESGEYTSKVLALAAAGKVVLLGGEKLYHPVPFQEWSDERWNDAINRLCLLRERFQFSTEEIQSGYERLRTEYLTIYPGQAGKFASFSGFDRLRSAVMHGSILISIAGFTFGGGEIMPIRLANQLYEMGYPVLVHSGCIGDPAEKVRGMLRKEIPVVSLTNVSEMWGILKTHGIRIVHTHHQAMQTFMAGVFKTYHIEDVVHVGTSHGMYENFDDQTLSNIFRQCEGGVDYWTYVADKNLPPFQRNHFYKPQLFFKVANGMKAPVIHHIPRSELEIGQDAFVFCLISRAILQKGWMQAIEAVGEARKESGRDIHLILVGDGPVYDELINSPQKDFVHLMGHRDNPCDYYALSDACLLPSYYKSESAPLTIIEALQCGIPVIATDLGEIANMLTIDGELAGSIFSLQNETIPLSTLTQHIIRMATDSQWYSECVCRARRKGIEFDIKVIAEKYLDVYKLKFSQQDALEQEKYGDMLENLLDSNKLLSGADRNDYYPKVTVIVPNYNHEKFLRMRLDSIYQQTYRNLEVLLLDDCSTDGSREILREYAQRYPAITRLLFNETNSGGVFRQWKKGIESATGELCWVAESDDSCDRNFLEKLVPAFRDEKMNIAYCQYIYIDEHNRQNVSGFKDYVSVLDKDKWNHSYTNGDVEEVQTALGIRNTIPNASGAVFRNPSGMGLLENNQWLSMRICGDWVFYLHRLKGGKIYYSVDTVSYFRFHQSTASAGTSTYVKASYYQEHETVAHTICDLYPVPDATLRRNFEFVKDFYLHHVGKNPEQLKEWYNVDKILEERQ